MIFLQTLFAFLSKLIDLALGYEAKQEQERAQAERNDLEEDPAGFFNKHFDGGVRNSTGTEGSGNSEANEANTNGASSA